MMRLSMVWKGCIFQKGSRNNYDGSFLPLKEKFLKMSLVAILIISAIILQVLIVEVQIVTASPESPSKGNADVQQILPVGFPHNWSAHPPIHVRGGPYAATLSPMGLSPMQIKTVYNLPLTGGSGTIAIIDAYDDPTVENDLNVFSSQFSLPPCTTANGCFEKHMMASSISTADSNWTDEISLDTQWAHAIAPDAKILLVEANTSYSNDLLSAIDYARSRSDVVAISMSWGGPEFSGESSFDSNFTSSYGAIFFASSGDYGTGVQWPAVSSNVVGVGGSTFTFYPNGSLASETAWSGSGGGLSAYESEPSYQTNYGVPNANGMRAVPDVSYNADPNSGVSVYENTTGWKVLGGTSAGAPQWAAIQSLGLSASNNNFYKDAKSISYSSYFRDITIGSNGLCGFYCNAAAGYDYVTGLGSPLTITYRSGGPDHFGYTFKDSNALGGPTYDWIEINNTGTEILNNSDDGFVDNLPVGFFFNFYGTDYSQLSITNNGLILASGGTSQYINQPIGSSTPHNFIAPFWDDIVTWGSGTASAASRQINKDKESKESKSNSLTALATSAPPGAIYYQTLGTAPNRMFVVEWYDNQHYHDSESGVTFEAILYEGTNNIKFQYKDVEFGNVTGSTSSDLPPYDKGGSATVGIESSDGRGLQYSYNEQVLSPGLAILFKFPQYAGTNLYLSKQAPVSKDRGSTMLYTLYYHNFGDTAASNVVLNDTLPMEVEFVSASDGGSYNPITRNVTWNIGNIVPSGHGYANVTVRINQSVEIGTIIQNNARISTSNLEVRYDDNEAQAQTKVTGSNLPPDVSVEPNNGGTTPSVYYGTPTTFSYHSCPTATGVNITIHIDDGGPDITGSMTGGPPDWIYTTTFYPRHGQAAVTYTIFGCAQSNVSFNIYIDPAGYIYDMNTGARISGASVWLQQPDGQGGWANVSTGQSPPIMQPDINPLTTGADGQYQWDVIAGSYRVHAEAPGYYPADSIAVSVPPPVTDLHVGLTRIALKGDLNNNGVPADAGDLVLMKRASIGEIPADQRYDLNNNGVPADAGDLVLMKRASIGEIIL